MARATGASSIGGSNVSRSTAPGAGASTGGRAACAVKVSAKCASLTRSAGVAADSHPSIRYGGMSAGTRPVIRSITKNGAPRGDGSASYQRVAGTGTALRPPTSSITRYWSSRS